MRDRGFEEVYQLDGGIMKYGQTYGDSGYWQGELYVFDERMNTRFSPQAKTLGECFSCAAPTSHFYNCMDAGCSTLRLYCLDCRHIPQTSRCEKCRDRKSTRLNSSHVAISYAVFCLKKKTKK